MLLIPGLLLLLHGHGAHGHGAMISPSPRNSFDRFLPAFAGGRAPADSTACNCGEAHPESGCDEGTRATGGGQSCLWFSQGCSIYCPSCTGIGSHAAVSLCNATKEPTLPKYAWTMNRGAPENGLADSYKHSPWRAPGSAPTTDACGTAGGTAYANHGPGDADFNNNSLARMGDLGSGVLPKGKAQATWRRGENVEVSWGIRYNHGGGYQYRLCPASEPCL